MICELGYFIILMLAWKKFNHEKHVHVKKQDEEDEKKTQHKKA